MNIPFFIAHRGGNQAPENTLEAFKSASKLGAKMCEFDIQLSKDNELIVIHDESLDRTSSGSGRVRDFDLKDIQKMGDIPSLTEVNNLCQKLNMAMNIEIKSFEDKNQNIKTAEKLIQWLHSLSLDPGVRRDDEMARTLFLRRHSGEGRNPGVDIFDGILISSFDSSLLYLIKQAFPNISLGYLVFINNWDQDWENLKNKIIKETQELGCLSFNINQEVLTPESIKEIKSCIKTPLVLTYTVNNLERIRFLKSHGVDGVFIDDLDNLKNIHDPIGPCN